MTVKSAGSIITKGQDSVGILAQSIGGGGGVGLDAFGNVTGSAGLVSLALGGSEGASVNPDAGGQIVLSSGGDITTSGRFAAGCCRPDHRRRRRLRRP